MLVARLKPAQELLGGSSQHSSVSIQPDSICISKNRPPYNLWTKKAPGIKNRRVFGCKAYISVPKHRREWKLGPTGDEGILLGYENETSSYRILRLRDKKVVITRWDNLEIGDKDVFFDCEEELLTSDNYNPALSTYTMDNENETNHASDREETMEGLTASNLQPLPDTSVKRIKVIGPRHPTHYDSSISNINILPYKRRPAAHLTVMSPGDTPRSYWEAMESSEWEFWLAAIKKEINSMERLKVWQQVNDEGQQKIGTTWVFRKKRDHTGKGGGVQGLTMCSRLHSNPGEGLLKDVCANWKAQISKGTDCSRSRQQS